MSVSECFTHQYFVLLAINFLFFKLTISNSSFSFHNCFHTCFNENIKNIGAKYIIKFKQKSRNFGICQF